jgi:hypothetical protein
MGAIRLHAKATPNKHVPVTLSVVEANGNYRDIVLATSEADSFFILNWTPDIQGLAKQYLHLFPVPAVWA